ncbi:putative bifunctional diguanylate cyclase/phosphodiesterase [Steroidobacter sp.]|uniref:putative bifunctional diguanylate cyclase/phosphodiesterase n=1 Tax=Steroidobacter sp. TaxID=1978227 RepID=UPI001A63050D|nr:EAL domain-containing protein [Steroidobacter sp.]MBL8268049.1 EAL domain-containing protein [Steroidobacter sp.]
MFYLAACLIAALCVVAAWVAHLKLRMREMAERVTEAESRHRLFIEQVEHGGLVRRKIEAQLLEKQQHLDRLAHHDQLTGLPNRLFLQAHLPAAVEDARRKKVALAVLFIDLDRFKHINDTHGHETGDKLLQSVSQRIKDAVRGDDIVVRMGGDEFVVVLNTVKSTNQVNETASRITAALGAPLEIDGKPIVTTASVGVSMFPRDGEDVGALLRHSDTAMYQAKDSGRNNFQLFSPVMDRKLKERVAIENSLRAALESENQLDVHYQPLIDIETRRVVTLEALVRWKHPTDGYIAPLRFIPVAEETGLIAGLGDFVIARVVEDMVKWRKAGHTMLVPVAINVSPGQLARCDLRQRIAELTQVNSLSPAMLQIELTEGAMFDQVETRHGTNGSEAGVDAINDLRALGVRVAIDDFGTGYSSLSYLKRWRVDYLKIDRSFIRDLVTDSNDHAIVGAIIAMAQHLKIKVIAEGVEGWSQLETLRKLGCRYAQGYLFAEPAPADKCRDFLNGRPLGLTDVDTDLLKAASA